ncbi:uncharacterized protein [Nothobranchius furzeri]|uniref:uncharacterized protein n=1 Tax=Nothobranchius furzeri TaxID=105023 RepID=UPI0039046844
MSRSLWEQVRLAAAGRGPVLELMPCAVDICPYSPAQMTLSNVVFLSISVSDMSMSHPVFVSDIEAFPFLLGEDLLQRFKTVISFGDWKLQTRLTQPMPMVPHEDLIPSLGVVKYNGAARVTSRSSTSKVSAIHSVCVVSAAESLHPVVGKPPTLGGVDSCSGTPPESPHPAVGTLPAKAVVDGGAETPAEAQHLAVGTPPAEGGADDFTDPTPLQLALVTSNPEVGDSSTKGEVECCPVPLLADPDLSNSTCALTEGLTERTPAPNSRKATPAPVYSLMCPWFQFSGLTKYLLLVACVCLISNAAKLPPQPPLT